MKKLAILTPSYNRAYTLPKLFDSLMCQTCFDFKWYIVDDGSTDDTAEKIKQFQNGCFEVVYIKKTNGGKHTALNEGMRHIEEALTFIVDSDDYLTGDAVETIMHDWKNYGSDPIICGLSYYRLYANGAIIGDPYCSDGVMIDTYTNVRINRNVKGDKAEIYRSDILKAYPFPEFPDEKFISEAIVWNAISRAGFQLAFIPKGIYYCEYLPGGLTANGRKYRLQNPLGTMEHAKSFLYSAVRFKYRIKYMLLYAATRPFANVTVKTTFHNLEKYRFCYLVCLLPGVLLAIYWKKKYKL